jgi:hypothetical protein
MANPGNLVTPGVEQESEMNGLFGSFRWRLKL